MSYIPGTSGRSGRVIGGKVGGEGRLDSQYYFGTAIVHPITEAVNSTTGKAKAKTWLPAGDWVRWDVMAGWTGPAEVTESFSVSEVPVYLPRGACSLSALQAMMWDHGATLLYGLPRALAMAALPCMRTMVSH